MTETQTRPEPSALQDKPQVLKVALLGCGTVGSQVARILLEDAEALAARSGARLELAGIAVRNPEAKRDVDLPRELFTADAEKLVLPLRAAPKPVPIDFEAVGRTEGSREIQVRARVSGILEQQFYT